MKPTEFLALLRPSPPSLMPSGLVQIDQKLGGYPTGILVEILGKEGTGKTQLGLKATLANDLVGSQTLYIDINQQLRHRWRKMQHASRYTLLSCVDSTEKILTVIRMISADISLKLVVIDSLNSLKEGTIPALYSLLRNIAAQKNLCILLIHSLECITPQRSLQAPIRIVLENKDLLLRHRTKCWRIKEHETTETLQLFQMGMRRSIIRKTKQFFVFGPHLLGSNQHKSLLFLDRNPQLSQQLYRALCQ